VTTITRRVKDLQDKLFSAYGDLYDSFNAFSDAFQPTIDAVEAQQLDSMRAAGQNILAAADVIVDDIGNIVNFFYESENAGNEFMQTDPDVYSSLYSKYQTDVKILQDYLADSYEVLKEHLTTQQVSNLNTFVTISTDYIFPYAEDAKNLLDAQSYDIDLSQGTSGDTSYYPPDYISSLYDQAVGYYNQSLN